MKEANLGMIDTEVSLNPAMMKTVDSDWSSNS